MTAPTNTRLEEALEQVDVLMSYQRRAFCAHAGRNEISFPQLFLLINLHERGPLSVSELSDLLGVTPPSASAIIDRMEERELVARERDASDRRVVHVVVTEHGQTVLDQLAGVKNDHRRQILSAMTDQELEHVIGAIKAITRVLPHLEASGT